MNESPDQAPDPSAGQATDGAPQRLRPSVGIAGTAVIAMANTAPTLSIGIGLGLISLDTGAAVPAMILLAVLPILGIATVTDRETATMRLEVSTASSTGILSQAGPLSSC